MKPLTLRRKSSLTGSPALKVTTSSGNEYLTVVDEAYIADEFNLKGLEKYFQDIRSVINYIIGEDSEDSNNEQEA